MRSILALALGLFSLQTAQAGPVVFGLSGYGLEFKRTTGSGGMDTVSFIDNGLFPGSTAVFRLSQSAPGGLKNLYGEIELASWKIGPITSSPANCGSLPCVETAQLFSTTGGLPPTTKFRIYDSNLTPSGNYIEADLAVDNIRVETSTGTSSGSIGQVGFNLLGAWSSPNVAGLSAALQNLYSLTSVDAVIAFGFSAGETLEERLAATVSNPALREVDYTGTITATPEPGFYGVLAGGLGALVWAFRRRKTEVA